MCIAVVVAIMGCIDVAGYGMTVENLNYSGEVTSLVEKDTSIILSEENVENKPDDQLHCISTNESRSSIDLNSNISDDKQYCQYTAKCICTSNYCEEVQYPAINYSLCRRAERLYCGI